MVRWRQSRGTSMYQRAGAHAPAVDRGVEKRMAMRRLLIVLAAVAAGVLLWPTASSMLFPSTFTAVRVAGVAFYTRMRTGQCAPQSGPSASFPASIGGIYDRVTFATWQGRHTLRTEWYAPGQKYYDSVTLNDRNIQQVCDYLPVYGDQAATLPGWWQLRVVVDGHALRSRSFRIFQVQPNPASYIPPALCGHGCSADLRTPWGSRVRMNFAGTQGLIAYLRWHPGTTIVLVVGRSG